MPGMQVVLPPGIRPEDVQIPPELQRQILEAMAAGAQEIEIRLEPAGDGVGDAGGAQGEGHDPDEGAQGQGDPT